MRIKPISSRDNPLYKELKQLATSSQARRKTGRTLLDGVHLCETYLQFKGHPPLCIVSESASVHSEVAAILAQCEAGATQCVLMPDALFHGLSQVEHGIDLLFVVETPRLAEPDGVSGSVVLLDNVQDPGNLGSILRSAAAAGIGSVFCSHGTAFSWSPKVLRAGMGAHFILNIFENIDLAALIQRAGIQVLATSSHAASRVYDADLRGDIGWIFGHEGQGVSDELLALAARQVSIPHLGAVESLNVAACAAVCLFEQVRQKTIAD